MTRKGRLEEVLSKALHADNPDLYTVTYRDFERLVEVRLQDFMAASENLSLIPPNRIYRVKRGEEVLYEKFLPRG